MKRLLNIFALLSLSTSIFASTLVLKSSDGNITRSIDGKGAVEAVDVSDVRKEDISLVPAYLLQMAALSHAELYYGGEFYTAGSGRPFQSDYTDKVFHQYPERYEDDYGIPVKGKSGAYLFGWRVRHALLTKEQLAADLVVIQTGEEE